MDLVQYLPVDLPKMKEQRCDNGKKLKERIESHAIEMHQLGSELFQKVTHKRKLEASIKTLSEV